MVGEVIKPGRTITVAEGRAYSVAGRRRAADRHHGLHPDGRGRPRRHPALTRQPGAQMNFPGLDFQLGEDVDALRDAVRALRGRRDRAARRRDRPQRPVPDGPVAQDGRARRAGHHRARGIRRRQHGLPGAHDRDGGNLARLGVGGPVLRRPQQPVRQPDQAQRQRRAKAQVPAQTDFRRACRCAGHERAGRRQRRDQR